MQPIEAIHPFQLQGAWAASGRLSLRYALAGSTPGKSSRVTAAHLSGPQGDTALTDAGPGLLQGLIPSTGGRYTLVVDAVADAAEAAPSLPWRVGVHLPPEALADYLAAEPLDAQVEADGVVIRAERLLRRPDGVVLYWRAEVPGAPLPWTGQINAQLGVGPARLEGTPLSWQGGRHAIRPAAAGQPGSSMQVAFQALIHQAYDAGQRLDGPLVWHIRHASLHAPGEARLELGVPAERPTAVPVGQSLDGSTPGLRLEEIWLSRWQTTLLFSGAGPALDLPHSMALRDPEGRTYRWTSGGSAGNGLMDRHFAPVPPGITHLVLEAGGPTLEIHRPLALPLEPGARGHLAAEDLCAHTAGHQDWGFTQVPIGTPEFPTPLSREEPPGPVPDEAQLEAWVQEHLVPAKRVIPHRTSRKDLNPRSSHYGGPPFWPQGEPWPICGHCDQPLTFIGQVWLAECGALLAFHYCFHCLPSGPHDASAYRLRLHHEVDSTPLDTSPPPEPEDTGLDLRPCRIEQVNAQSAPHWEDAEPHLAGLDLGSRPWQAYHEVRQRLTGAPNVESRLGGAPDWVQGPEWPACPHCGGDMELLWQIDSEDATGLQWGDMGRIYIFGCQQGCSEQGVALVMQCG